MKLIRRKEFQEQSECGMRNSEFGIRNSEFCLIKSAIRIPKSGGMTLIEIIMVMVIIGILAATVLPRIDFGATSSRASVDGAAYMIASDIRYAQEFAMANRVSKRSPSLLSAWPNGLYIQSYQQF